LNTYYKNKNARLYQCDNLELLNSLPDNYIDLIYCDILYNTGKKFKYYDDNLGTSEEAMEWYKPRLIEMQRVLKDSGLIYIHCDWRLHPYIRIELDKLFNINNFRNEIIWEYNSAPRKKKDFGKRHDIILRYSKTNEYYFNDQSQYIRESYSPTAPRGYEKERYYNPLGKIVGDVWKINMLGQNDKTERTGYDTQKPKKLLERIVDSSSNKEDIVADFFMGSGTTGEVAIELGRKFIGCDINEKACEISKQRIEKISVNYCLV